MHTLTTDTVADLLRQRATGSYADEAATELLIAHRVWLDRRDFLTACVDYDHDGHHPVVWVDWHRVPAFLDAAPCSASEARILRLATELSGIDTGWARSLICSAASTTATAPWSSTPSPTPCGWSDDELEP